MASEALEEKKPEEEAPVEDKQEVEAEEEAKEEPGEDEEKEDLPEVPEKATENEEEVAEEGEETPKKGKRTRRASSKKQRGGDSAVKKPKKEAEVEKKEKEPVTPVSERPTRERKVVERYSAPESGRSSATKPLNIEKGRGTQLKDIPNVAFKLSKRKPDDNLQLLHTILFGKKAKSHSLKRNIVQFSGYVWAENEQEKQRTRVKEKLDKCVKEKLMDFCDVLNIQINKAGTKKEELSAKLLEFLESPHATTDVLLAEKEQKGQKRKKKVTPSKIAGSGEGSPETPAKKQKDTPSVEKNEESTKDEEDEFDDKVEPSNPKDDPLEEDDDDRMNEETDHGDKSDEEEDEPKDQVSSPNGCTGNEKPRLRYKVEALDNTSWINHPYSVIPIQNKEDCSDSCLEDCNCWAVLYTDANCSKYKPPLLYGKTNSSISSKGFFKVLLPRNMDGMPNNFPELTESLTVTENKNNSLILILAITLGSIAFLCFVLAISSFTIYKHRVHRYEKLLKHSSLALADQEYFTLQSFSYAVLERATDGFKEEIGRGTFGAVYKGTLSGASSNKTVAVKRLEKVVDEGVREFIAEITTIGRTHHRNLVQLLGFCIEGSRKLLVYEYMSNGSLADLIFKAKSVHSSWKERVRLVFDVAKGVLYLHDECSVHIIHSNLKPQNVLLDHTWTAKISDFGLARLVPNETKINSTGGGEGGAGTVEQVRRGYLAPEWQKNAFISVKADIYSFGIVLLEIVCCRRNIEVNVSTPDEIILSSWVSKCFAAGELDKLVEEDENVDLKTLERMVKVGLWCVQDDPALRPFMKNVILMLEGTMDIPVPPCPELPSLV